MTLQANQLLKTILEWRLLPPVPFKQKEEGLSNHSCAAGNQAENFNPHIRTIPSLFYGPVHLLRLFVKMPEILGRMRIPSKKSKLIVKYMESLLEYLESQPSLFTNESVYE